TLDPDSQGDFGCIFFSHKKSVARVPDTGLIPSWGLLLEKSKMVADRHEPTIMLSASSTAERSDQRERTRRSRAQSRTDAATRVSPWNRRSRSAVARRPGAPQPLARRGPGDRV